VSNLDGENPEFDDSELEDLGVDPSEEVLPSDEPGSLPELEPTEGMPEPGDETMETGAAEEPGEEALQADADALAPVEVPAEEEPLPEEEEGEKGPGLLARLTKTTPYVVLLGISLLAILIGILCLWLELRRYDSQIKPPQVGAAPVVQSGPANTTAAV
jgi:hypothetical protein